MMTKISATSSELGYQMQQQPQNEHLYTNQLMLTTNSPSINCYGKIGSAEDLTTALDMAKVMLTDDTMTALQQPQLLQDNSLKFPTDENNHNARALQLALELSIVSLNSEQQNHANNASQHMSILSSGMEHQGTSKTTTNITQQNEHPFQKSFLENSSMALGMIEERTKKSQNMTECVPVPSSEHVAEIVGRQGNLH